jgi:hypothetical protein
LKKKARFRTIYTMSSSSGINFMFTKMGDPAKEESESRGVG